MAPGLETYIAVSRTFISKQPAPYSDCLNNDFESFSAYSETIFDFFNGLNATEYDQDLCINLCYQDKLIKKCNCASLIINKLNGARYCENETEIACEEDFDTDFVSSDPDDFCEGVCKPECEGQKFDYSISLAKFPTQDYINLHPSEKPIMRFILDYADSTYTVVSQEPDVTFEILLGDIGGQILVYWNQFS